MKCVNFCLIGSALLGSSLVTMATSKTSGNFKKFNDLLTDDQKKIYKDIHKERLTIYIQGLILGTLLAIFVTKQSAFKQTNNVCLFVTIALGVNWMYYLLYPKTKYMLEELGTKEQNKAWLAIYKEMKLRCLIGLILGAAGNILLGFGMCM
mgnify:CR=1 FL=1